MDEKIDKAIKYYTVKSEEILNYINSNTDLTAEQIIQRAEELSVLEYKLTALEVAKENWFVIPMIYAEFIEVWFSKMGIQDC